MPEPKTLAGSKGFTGVSDQDQAWVGGVLGKAVEVDDEKQGLYTDLPGGGGLERRPLHGQTASLAALPAML